MDLGLRGKTALVTGASRGIGKAIAEGLAEEGCDLVLAARDVATMTELSRNIAERHGVRVSPVAADLVTMVDAMELTAHLDRVDILVNNAGAIPAGALGALTEAQAREAMELKLFVYMRLARQCFQAMSARGSGVILNVIGTAGDRPRSGYALGSMVNASLVAMTRSLGLQAMNHGVRVVGLHPGATRTDRKIEQLENRSMLEFGTRERWPELASRYPYGRLAEPSEIAAAAVFLCSHAASYVNATCLTADGGATDSMV